jgi:hypothetical protein
MCIECLFISFILSRASLTSLRPMKWPRYQRIISLEIQVGITSQINKWANTDPRRWDQVLRRTKHPLLTGCTRREPHFKRKKHFEMENPLYSKYQVYIDPWKYQRWDQVPRRVNIHKIYKPCLKHRNDNLLYLS